MRAAVRETAGPSAALRSGRDDKRRGVDGRAAAADVVAPGEGSRRSASHPERNKCLVFTTLPLSSRPERSWALRPTQVDEKPLLRFTTNLSSRPKRTRISYFTAPDNGHECGPQQRGPHALDRPRDSRQEIRGSGVERSAVPFQAEAMCFSTERTWISYLTALDNGHVCDSPQRETHELNRSNNSQQEIRGSAVEGPAVRPGAPC